jgi:hypothetical protein
MAPPRLYLAGVFHLAVAESIQLELIRQLAVIVSAVCGVLCAWISMRNQRQLREQKREARRRRRTVRDPATEQVVVIDEPGDEPRRIAPGDPEWPELSELERARNARRGGTKRRGRRR